MGRHGIGRCSPPVLSTVKLLTSDRADVWGHGDVRVRAWPAIARDQQIAQPGQDLSEWAKQIAEPACLWGGPSCEDWTTFDLARECSWPHLLYVQACVGRGCTSAASLARFGVTEHPLTSKTKGAGFLANMWSLALDLCSNHITTFCWDCSSIVWNQIGLFSLCLATKGQEGSDTLHLDASAQPYVGKQNNTQGQGQTTCFAVATMLLLVGMNRRFQTISFCI